MEKKRSVGLTIIGILFIIGSILPVAILFSSRLPVISSAMIILFGFALLGFYTGVGILMLKSPARLIGIALVAVKIPYGIIKTFMDFNILVTKSSMPKPLVLLICSLSILLIVSLDVGIIYYLTRPKVKEQFK